MLATPAAGRVRVSLLPTLQESISVPIAEIGGLEKILTLFENFVPPFPEKEVREINGSIKPKRISPVWPQEFLQQSKPKQTRKINEHENHKICNRNRLTARCPAQDLFRQRTSRLPTIGKILTPSAQTHCLFPRTHSTDTLASVPRPAVTSINIGRCVPTNSFTVPRRTPAIKLQE